MSKIGLIDVDSHSNVPNIALMKLSAWHKAQGDDVEWYDPFGGQYDKVYMSKVFTFTEDYAYPIHADEIEKGGTGYDIIKKLPDEIDKIFYPDYSIYPKVPKDTAYGFLTRGCIRKCKWCVVNEKEGFIHPYADIEEVCRDRKKAVLFDNNVVGCDYGLEQIEKIIKLGISVDFNQAMDARLVTPEIAQMLAKVKWLNYIRFGCDTHAQIAHCERAIELLRKYGYKGMVDLYTMIYDDINECYERISYWRHPRFKWKVVCQAQPMLDLHSKVQHIPLWEKVLARYVNRKAIFLSTDFKDYVHSKGIKGSDFFK